MRLHTGTARWLVAALAAAGIAALPAAGSPVAPGASAPAIEAVFAAPGAVQIDDLSIDLDVLRPVYERHNYAPLWVTGSSSDARLPALAAVLADAGSEGLDPKRYHSDAILRRLGTTDPQETVRLDLLLSDAVRLYAVDQKRGVSPPPRGHPEIAFDRPQLDVDEVVVAVASATDPVDQLRSLAPDHESYRRLRTALALYRQIEKAGGWESIPDGPTLKVGMSSPAVPAVRRRLAITGELSSPTTSSSKYDAALAAGVRTFQQRNGIAADGVLGAATRQTMNVPVDQRIEQIIVNMERWRWIHSALGTRYVIVNVPAFTLDLVDANETRLSMPVAVGTTELRTPMFSAEIRQLVFNPSWLVPPKIVREEILPKAKGDPQYLSREGYHLRHFTRSPAAGGDDHAAGDGVPATLTVTRLTQAPGPKNPLGRVKFSMPNAFGVYLHDTPSRASLTRPMRALSHGCVRLSKALALADALMANVDGWDERRQQLLSSWDTHTITIPNPIPVHVLYETAWSDASGIVHFRPDLYGRDEALAREMAEPRGVRPTSVAGSTPESRKSIAAP